MFKGSKSSIVLTLSFEFPSASFEPAAEMVRSLKQGSSPSNASGVSVFFVVLQVICDGALAAEESMLIQGGCSRLKVVDEELRIKKLETEHVQCQGGNRWKLFLQQ
jgi:hypothetical protein